MKKYISFLLILLISLILLSLSSCGLFEVKLPDDETEDISSPRSETNTVHDTELTVTLPVDTTAEETTTQEIIITPAYPGKDLSISGEVLSGSRNLLKLHIEWGAEQTKESENAVLTVKVFIDSYGITISSRNDCKLIINGEETIFIADAIKYEDNSLASILIYTHTVEIYSPAEEISTVDVSASYYFGGSYGGVTLGWLEVAGEIVLDPEANKIIAEPADPLAPELPESPFKPIITVD